MSGAGELPAEAVAALQAMAAEGAALRQTLGAPVTDALADWLTGQHVLAAQAQLAAAEGAERWAILRALAQDWAALRRGDQRAAQLQLDRKELELKRSNTRAQKEVEFEAWLQRPDIREKYFPNGDRTITKETIEKIERELRLM